MSRYRSKCSAIFQRRLLLETLERRDVPSFAAPQAYAAASNPADIVSADFNGDGHLDVAVANQTTPGFVNVALNNGGGAFSAPRVSQRVAAAQARWRWPMSAETENWTWSLPIPTAPT